MNDRDWEYIENRLLAPTVAAIEAIERMEKNGKHTAAARLRRASVAFTDECRSVRQELRTDQQIERAAQGS